MDAAEFYRREYWRNNNSSHIYHALTPLPSTPQHAAEDDDERAAAMRARALTDADWVVKKFEGQTDADVVRLNGGSTPSTRSRSERGGQGDDPLARFPSTSHW